METMIPLGLVLGWIFAVLGLLALVICFACVMASAALDHDAENRFSWCFVISTLMLIVGVVFVVLYWRGGA